MSQYPHTPGFKGESDTGRDAAAAMAPKAATIRTKVLDLLKEGPKTGETIFAELTRQGVQTVLYSIKPRLSEARAMGLVADSGLRGRSDSGKLRSIVWRLTTAEERSLFAARRAAEDEKGPLNG